MFNKQTILARARWLSDCVIFDETDSTQREAKASGRANCLYLTNQQLATYGRFGRAYFASSEGGIYMSVCLRPQAAFDELPQYTLLAAAAVVSAIEKLTDKKPLIKWVNDIYLGDKKIVGILTEATTRATGESQIILGMGINFAISEFP
ncbi:MAG: biotin--[acetyl-CoA-carboxylase] ligase, partial [Streptococcaceae bacterium]|nr:biotin--[acetyl-CoA-carboxylase] ligase [Streptococcaceae bacterium]